MSLFDARNSLITNCPIQDLEIIKISSDQNDTNIYYKISNNGNISFDNLERILDKDKNYIMVKGSVPGPRNNTIMVLK